VPQADLPDPADGETRSMVPFLAALGIFVVVVITIAILSVTSGDGLTEEQRVGRAAVGQNDALQRLNYADFRAYTCAQNQGNEADVLARQRDSQAKQGAGYVDDVTGVVINGDHATGTVVYHFAHLPDTKSNAAVTFAREGGSWKVCWPGSGMPESR
jgi:hypothetical protein